MDVLLRKVMDNLYDRRANVQSSAIVQMFVGKEISAGFRKHYNSLLFRFFFRTLFSAHELGLILFTQEFRIV